MTVFQALCDSLDGKGAQIKDLQKRGRELWEKSPESAAQELKHNLHTLQARWDNIQSKAEDKKVQFYIHFVLNNDILKTDYPIICR